MKVVVSSLRVFTVLSSPGLISVCSIIYIVDRRRLVPLVSEELGDVGQVLQVMYFFLKRGGCSLVWLS